MNRLESILWWNNVKLLMLRIIVARRIYLRAARLNRNILIKGLLNHIYGDY